MQAFDIRIHKHGEPVKEIKNQLLPATQKIVADRDYSRIEVRDSVTGVEVAVGIVKPSESKLISPSDRDIHGPEIE